MSELNSNNLLRCTDAIDKVKSGSQPLQETKGLRIKFAGNKKKAGNKKEAGNKIKRQKAIRAGSLLW